ncbi:MAG: PAC2 family protein [Chloroflexi bacterium]|nr:PAC2 family protein [Chloroflexota bacterium]
MSELVELWEKPEADQKYMVVGWRQWADAGSVSSGLPEYLVQQMGGRQIGSMRSDGFYIFQVPGTHDLVRPVVKFEEGYPSELEIRRNDFFYAEDNQNGYLILLGDEPHLDIERYVKALLDTAASLRVKRVIGLGGVYGELPYDKERMISATYSLPHMKDEIQSLAVNLSDYHGGASIGSYLARRAGDRGMEYVGFYAFVPTYDFSSFAEIGNTIRIENDYMAWLGIMRRMKFMLKMDLDLADLEEKSQRLVKVVDDKMEEFDNLAPQVGVRDYLSRLSEDFTEIPFEPLDDFWEDEIRRLMDKFDSDET